MIEEAKELMDDKFEAMKEVSDWNEEEENMHGLFKNPNLRNIFNKCGY